MEAALSIASRPPLTRDDLSAQFVRSFKRASKWRVGTEFEKFGITADNTVAKVKELLG